MRKTKKIVIAILAVLGGFFALSRVIPCILLIISDFVSSREKKCHCYHSDHLDEDIRYDEKAKHPDFKVDDITRRVYITLPSDN